jgi:HlyD family secretion protein
MRGKWFSITASAALVALAAAGVTLLLRVSPKKSQPVSTAPKPAPPSAEIRLTGKIRAQNVVRVSPPLEGTVGAFFVDVGQEVFEGQLLARLSNEGLDTEQQIAKRSLESAQERIDTLESQVIAARLEASRARADSTRARSEYERVDKVHRRQQMLYAEGATPRLTYEKSNRDFDLAQTDFRNLEHIASLAEARVEDLVKNLDAEKRALAAKGADLETAQAQVTAAEVLSPVQGLVVARNGDVGQPVAPDRADFFEIATQLSQLEVVLDPDPLSISRIQPGQPALVSLPEQGAEDMAGAVKAITGAQVIVAFTSPNPAIKPGMLAQVRIKVG